MSTYIVFFLYLSHKARKRKIKTAKGKKKKLLMEQKKRKKGRNVGGTWNIN